MPANSNCIIVHGAYGYPEENWFPWLKCELGKLNISCLIPALPTPVNQSLESWLSAFDAQTAGCIDNKTILIGHSLGVLFILHWLSKRVVNIQSIIFVGGFLGPVGIDIFDHINQDFFSESFDWSEINSSAREFTTYYSPNDNYVKRCEFDLISRHVLARKIIVSNAGHFNCQSGYLTFPHLLKQIKSTYKEVIC